MIKMKNVIKGVLPDRLYDGVKKGKNSLTQELAVRSLRCAIEEQGLSDLAKRLKSIEPDLREQYSNFEVKGEYLNTKVRGVHAFQMSLVAESLGMLKDVDNKELTVVDIGDSAGTHIRYASELFKERNIRSLSVNLDSEAVKRIREKGLVALCASAEDVTRQISGDVDVFLCFETLEHLFNPVKFLHDISANTGCRSLVVTVPYLRNSRVGLHQVRRSLTDPFNAENTHLFELSPESWRLLFLFSGWKVVSEKVYWQYPKKHWLRLTRPYWRKNDFEGFYGAVLARDYKWSKLYTDW
ncbi:MAG: hypothetical protein GF409_04980 [Candidatus Omnitrophica bacterium]|nr:hypothetical protein [Candidatus Omnitrophota bacterium]